MSINAGESPQCHGFQTVCCISFAGHEVSFVGHKQHSSQWNRMEQNAIHQGISHILRVFHEMFAYTYVCIHM